MENEKHTFIAKYDLKTSCWSCPPIQLKLVSVDIDGKVLGTKTYGRQDGEKCPHCNRLWELH